MPEFNVMHTGYVSHVETVEAATPEAAIEAAQAGNVSLCSPCSHEWDAAGDTDVFSVTDADGNEVWQADPHRSADDQKVMQEAHIALTEIRRFVQTETPSAVGTLAELDRVLELTAKALSS